MMTKICKYDHQPICSSSIALSAFCTASAMTSLGTDLCWWLVS